MPGPDSNFADHCRYFALSDPDSKDFQVKCKHQLNMLYKSCEELKTTLKELETSIKEHSQSSFNQDHRETLIHDFKQAKDYIYKWKSHIVPSVIVDFRLLFKARLPRLLSTCQLRFQIRKLGVDLESKFTIFALFSHVELPCIHTKYE